MHVCDSLQYIREVSVYWKSPQYVFRGPGFGKFEGQDSGFLRKRGRKFRIVINNWYAGFGNFMRWESRNETKIWEFRR